MTQTPPNPYQQWLNAVNLALESIAGIGMYDLPDQPFQDWYESEMTPQEAARIMLEEEGFPFDEDEFDDEGYFADDERFNGFDLV